MGQLPLRDGKSCLTASRWRNGKANPMQRGPCGVGNRTIPDMINFCPPGTPITIAGCWKTHCEAWGVQQVQAGRFLYSRRHGARRRTRGRTGPLSRPGSGGRMGNWVITDRYHFNLLLPQLVTICGLSLAGFEPSSGCRRDGFVVKMVAVTGDDDVPGVIPPWGFLGGGAGAGGSAGGSAWLVQAGGHCGESACRGGRP